MPHPEQAFIGLMSGTSADGVDACLATFRGGHPRLLASASHAFDPDLRGQLLDAIGGRLDLAEAARLDTRLADAYAAAVESVLAADDRPPGRVRAIGCHGQTVIHRPDDPSPTSVQLGDPHRLAVCTGIDVVADLRRGDLADGGQGAPLAPAFHAYAFGARASTRAVVNIGGIANLTVVEPNRARVRGFDTGPGNALLDGWIQRHRHSAFDRDGLWAASGRLRADLLDALLDDPYFAQLPPKSTGREHFNLAWLERALARLDEPPRPADVQATLVELTAVTIARAVTEHAPSTTALFACGGGAYNTHLLERVGALLPGIRVASTQTLGIAPEHVEALAFAWLAQRRVRGLPGNLPEVTGARRPLVLGSLIRAPRAC